MDSTIGTDSIAAVGAIVALAVNSIALLTLVFKAGRLTQTVEHQGQLIDRLEVKLDKMAEKVDAAVLLRRSQDLEKAL